MTRVICVANKKGGSGKTTLVVNLAAALGTLGKRVLIIDLDPQCHATLVSGIDPYKNEKGIGSIMSKTIEPQRAVKKAINNLYDVIPSYHNDEPYVFYGLQEHNYRDLVDKFKTLFTDYDFVLIDTPPSREDILTFAFLLSNQTLVPMPFQFLAMEGLSEFIGYFTKFSTNIKSDIEFLGVVPVNYDLKTNHSREIYRELKDVLGIDMIKQGIKYDVNLVESTWAGEPVITYKRKCISANEFMKLAEELI